MADQYQFDQLLRTNDINKINSFLNSNYDFKIYAATIRDKINHDHIEIVKLLLNDYRFKPNKGGINYILDRAWYLGYKDLVLSLGEKYFDLIDKDEDYYKFIVENQHKYIMDSTIAMSGLDLPPYILAQILSENVTAYDLYNIAESITPILHRKKPIYKDVKDETGKLITIAFKREPVKLKPKFIQV